MVHPPIEDTVVRHATDRVALDLIGLVQQTAAKKAEGHGHKTTA